MVKPLTDGFILMTPEGIETAFAQDLTTEEKALILAVQPQTAGAIFGAKPTAAAWRDKPTWYVETLITGFGYSVIDLGNLRDGGLIQQAGGPLAGRNLFEEGERHK